MGRICGGTRRVTTVTPRMGAVNYRVQRGDTLTAIAIRFQVDVASIQERNDLSEDDQLKAGDVLIIPLGPENAPVGTPTATPTPHFAVAPPLVAPADHAQFQAEDTPLLRWVSVGLLPDDVWYAVQLDYVDFHLHDPAPLLTKATSLRLDAALQPPPEATTNDILWWVQLMRLTPEGALQPTSPKSEVRSFSWP